jgi:hypothetical protein
VRHGRFGGDLRETTVERVSAAGTARERGVLTGASDRVDGGVGEDGDAARSDTRAVGTDANGTDSAFKALRGRVVATWRRRADRRARRGKRRLTGGPLMSAISELKCTPGRK